MRDLGLVVGRGSECDLDVAGRVGDGKRGREFAPPSATQVFDTDDPDQRHITEHYSAVGGRQEELWNRWRRLESRKKRRT